MGFLAHLRRVRTYLGIAGAFPRWDSLFYAAVFAFGAYSMWTLGEADDAVLAALLIAPILAGTGLLTIAREGRIDLLFGAGVSRLDVWIAAFLRSVVVPATGIALCAAWWLRSSAGLGLGCEHVFILGLFTMGLTFAVGVLQPRYLAGILWCGVRVTFLISSVGRTIFMQLAHPDQAGAATLGQSIVGLFGYPETLLHGAVSTLAIGAALLVTTVALAVSLTGFMLSDFGGHRTT